MAYNQRFSSSFKFNGFKNILKKKTIICRMDQQQGPAVQHKELYSISCEKS